MREQRRVNFRAGWVRILLAGAAIFVAPALQPAMAAHRGLVAVYLGIAAISQLMIWKQVGGWPRALGMGIVDLALLTFVVHRLGTMTAMLVMLYMLVGMLYALVLSLRIAQLLALIGSGMYLGVLWAEAMGKLPYAADAATWAYVAPPHPTNVLVATVMFPVALVGAVTLVGKLIHEIRRREVELERLSQLDPLTKLFNRRYLIERIDIELARVDRGHPLTVVMADLDRFKQINDEHGHLRGDEVMVEVAQALAGATRKIDVVGRYGGDEFLLLLPDTTAEEALTVIDRALPAIRRVGERFDASCPVTASLGVAEAGPTDAVTTLLRRADDNAYQAKRAGGNRFVR